MKTMRKVLAVVLGCILAGSLALADGPSTGGGGPFKPCPTCKTIPGNMGAGGK
jgi:hypothetical protein